jgi:hypothetical protein
MDIKFVDLIIYAPSKISDFVLILKIAKKLKNIKFDLKRYFNKKIMFNGLIGRFNF